MTQPPELGVLAAVLARQSSDLSLYADFLTTLLSGSLPPEQLRVERKRGLFGTKPDAAVLMVAVHLGERTYVLRRPNEHAGPVAEIAHVVNGVTLSTRRVDLASWNQELAAALRALTETNADTAARLARLTGYTV